MASTSAVPWATPWWPRCVPRWVAHLVLFFPDQDLAPDVQADFARQFGEVTPAHPVIPAIEGNPEVLNIDGREDRASWWHTDVTFLQTPPLGSILHMREAPSVGGDTMWVSLQAAYDALAAPVRAMCDQLIAWHHDPWFAADVEAQGGYEWDGRITTSSSPSRTRSCGRTPRPGATGCSSTPQFTRFLEGMSKLESDALLDMLYRHCQRPEFSCRYRWEAGAVAFWDNRATLHYALDDYGDALRIAHRVTLRGDRPYGRPAHYDEPVVDSSPRPLVLIVPTPRVGPSPGPPAPVGVAGRTHADRSALTSTRPVAPCARTGPSRSAPRHWRRDRPPARVLAHDVGAARDDDGPGLHDDHGRAQLEDERDVVLHEKDRRRRSPPGVAASSGMNASASRWAMPAVGSSSRRSRGPASTIDARSTTRRVPVERCPVRWWRNRSRPNEAMARSTVWRLSRSARRAHGSCRVVDRTLTRCAGVLAQHERVLHRELGVEAAVLERTDDAERAPFLGDVVGQVLAVERQRALRSV